MYSLLVILVVLASVLMCLIVLVQESKGGGLASSFSENNAMLGVRKTTDVVEKITWGLAIAMVVFSILSVAFMGSGRVQQSVLENAAPIQQTTTGIPTGAQGQQPAQQTTDAPAPAETPAE